jgi:RNA polymerase sigma factor (sigma-70 family)
MVKTVSPSMSQDMITLLEPLIPSLRRYARSLLRHQEAADDLVQDCIERAISRWHQRRDDGDARTWLFTILHNLAMNQLKKNARRGVHVPMEDMDETLFSTAPNQEDHLRHQAVLDALAQLADDHRSVLLLISVEDLSYTEAAAVLGVPIGTVMSRLSRARHQLTQILNADHRPLATAAPVLRRVK